MTLLRVVKHCRNLLGAVYVFGPLVCKLRLITALAHLAAGGSRAVVWRDAALKTKIEQVG